MKRVVLSEGPNDLVFLRRLHDHYATHDRYDTFDNEREEIDQSTRLRQHRLDDTYDYLYKAEGGRSKLSRIFANVSVDLEDRDVKLYVLVDLDGDSTAELVDQFTENLTPLYGNLVSFVVQSQRSHADLCILDCLLKIDGGDDIAVDVFAFHQNLESATGIVHGEDRSTTVRKVNRYITEQPRVVEEIAEQLYPG